MEIHEQAFYRWSEMALFGERAKTFFEAKDNECMECVEQFRHLFAHRAGYVDETFKRKTSKYVKFGERLDGKILLTGEMVGPMVGSTNKSGKALIAMVDDAFIEAKEEHWYPHI